ncbi:sce7726 family protein [Pseudomonas mosselii]|uniref:sce7726 family protein n=1 Tax=Pseudomonas mosselii TaxID=78327 RepID=UPI00244A38FA|nr:sce7726 family protein [Pseudomonas mosselii]MDH0628671.1 sce7726 family protein [Pseudomonas mosselii]MDH0680704.1 sce7726 family protein [Pseudomonas mosselii]MDH0928172.1 sce7726 family protein [Pseudomonas mosselii]MDH1136753.1 sce7726 family protein [Pseudomonas mosselii]MDH1141212.1 sce7726 family protein [Pseudomonas mosselii]
MREIDIKRKLSFHLLKQDTTEVVFFEYPFHFGRRRADIISSENGMIIGYEIKSVYDRIDRLKEQLESYSQLFDYVYVVCDDKHISTIRKTIPSRVGIYTCSPTGINRIRKAKQIKNFDTITTLDAMPIDVLRREFKASGKSKLEICKNISEKYDRKFLKHAFRNHITHKYGAQTAHLKTELSDFLTLDDVYSLSLAPNRLDS